MNDLDKDNWLQEEIQREKRVSAWDFDEGKKLKVEHEENCDASSLYEGHVEKHNRARNDRSKNYSVYTDTHEDPSMADKLAAKVFFGCFISVFVLTFLGVMTSRPSLAIVPFLLVNPGIFIMMLLTKGKPISSKTLLYWLCVFIFDIYKFLEASLFLVRGIRR